MSTTTSTLSALTPGTWNVDASHSTIGFTARHLMITKVHGTFRSFGGVVTVAENPLQSRVEATIDASSVATGDDSRDGHLKSSDFFDVERHPTWSFVSTGISERSGDYVLKGDLTIKGVTKPVAFDLEFDGVNTDPWGNQKAAFSATTEINRKDWSLEWNVALEAGGVLVSEKVKIALDIQAVKA